MGVWRCRAAAWVAATRLYLKVSCAFVGHLLDLGTRYCLEGDCSRVRAGVAKGGWNDRFGPRRAFFLLAGRVNVCTVEAGVSRERLHPATDV